MSKFTSGPWHFQSFKAPPGKFISSNKIVGMDGEYVCDMTGNKTEANARLIAKAPTMFDQLKMAAQSLRIAGMHDSAARIEKLIAEIEGES